MNKNSPNTEEILDAIKNMMSEKSVHHDERLPKDVIELTNPINDKKIENIEEIQSSINIGNLIGEDQIKQAVRNAVDLLPQSKLDQIINEELTKIIQERINSSKIIISTENKKN